MSVTVFLERRPYGGLMPRMECDAEALAAYPVGMPLRAEIAKPSRSAKAERWYRALLKKVADGIGENDPKVLHTDLKFRTKRVRGYSLRGGETHILPISNADMDYGEFRRYLDDALDVLLADIVPGMKRADLIAEVEAMTGTKLSELPMQDEAPLVPQASSPGVPHASGEETEARLTLGSPVAPPTYADTLRGYHEHLSTFEGVPRDLARHAKTYWLTHERSIPPTAIEAVYTAHLRRCVGESNAAQCEQVLNGLLAMQMTEGMQ